MFWYLNDHLGSANVIMDESGQLVEHTLYYPFGAHREGGTEKYTFTGKELDSEIGLYYFEARYYNPQTFVFTQADSVIPNVYNPQSLNRYSYCYNNPVKYTDPDGHIPLIVATTAAGAIAGGIVGGGGEFIRQYNAAGGSIWSDIRNRDVTSVIAFAQSDDVNWGSVGAHAVGGAVAGGVAGLTMGAGISVFATGGLAAPASTAIGYNMLGAGAANQVASGAVLSLYGGIGNAAGGVAGRAVENILNGGSNTWTYAVDGGKIIGDFVGGAVGVLLGPAATSAVGKPVATVISKVNISPAIKEIAPRIAPSVVTTTVSNTASNAVNSVVTGTSNAYNTASNTYNTASNWVKSLF
ncbi:MAG: RHS repeat-associated core domain-containing protein, partial [Methanimicrococcus sp.]|nr:RHS repeat-associated core domain-containing protein [Methanimicrococcus sp.]